MWYTVRMAKAKPKDPMAAMDRTSQVLFAMAIRLPVRQQRYVEAVAAGMKPISAKVHANVGEAELSQWMAKGGSFLDALNGVKALADEQWAVTREDATKGLYDAIDSAKMANAPQAMVSGWREMIALHGLAEPGARAASAGARALAQRGSSFATGASALSRMSDAEVLEAADADWTEVPRDA